MLKKCSDSFIAQAKTKVKIQSKAETVDDYGATTGSWSDLFTVFAIVKPLSTFEVINSKALQSEVTHSVTVRYRSDLADTGLTAKYRLLIDNRVYSIQGVQNLDRDMKSYGSFYQKITCRDNGSEKQ